MWIPCPHKEGIKGIHILQKEILHFAQIMI